MNDHGSTAADIRVHLPRPTAVTNALRVDIGPDVSESFHLPSMTGSCARPAVFTAAVDRISRTSPQRKAQPCRLLWPPPLRLPVLSGTDLDEISR